MNKDDGLIYESLACMPPRYHEPKRRRVAPGKKAIQVAVDMGRKEARDVPPTSNRSREVDGKYASDDV